MLFSETQNEFTNVTSFYVKFLKMYFYCGHTGRELGGVFPSFQTWKLTSLYFFDCFGFCYRPARKPSTEDITSVTEVNQSAVNLIDSNQ